MHRTEKNLDIEVLRAVAVLMILIDHVKFLTPWAGASDTAAPDADVAAPTDGVR